MKRSRVNCKIIETVCILLIIAMAALALPVAAQSQKGNKSNIATRGGKIVRLLEDIPQGSRITKTQVELVEAGDTYVPANAASTLEETVGMYVREDLYKGEYVQKNQLSESATRKANPDLLKKKIVESNDNYVIVTDYVIPNTGEDISYFLQQIIDQNGNRTIYFPDGVYTIAHPLIMSSKMNESVSLRFADGAVLKAHNDWKGRTRGDGNDALIRIGADGTNTDDFVSLGSYYNVIGGIFDGNSRANGINVECGLEVVVRDACIINAPTGFLIKDGVHSRSSCVDVEDLTIVGDGATGKVGMCIVGLDNTINNIRIYNMPIGLENSNSGGNFIKGIYVYNTSDKLNRLTTVGITSKGTDWISQCYVENCDIAYELGDKVIAQDNTAAWTNGFCRSQTAYSILQNPIILSACRADFFAVEGGRYVYRDKVTPIEAPIVDRSVTFEGLDGVKDIPYAN